MRRLATEAAPSTTQPDLQAYLRHRRHVLTFARQLDEALYAADATLPNGGVRNVFAQSRQCLDDLHLALAGVSLR